MLCVVPSPAPPPLPRKPAPAHLSCHASCLRLVQPPPQCLLIVRQLYDQGHVKGLLQPLSEHDGNKVTQVQRLGRRALKGGQGHTQGHTHRAGLCEPVP